MGKMSKIKSEKFTFFTFWMTICIIVYHTAPHLLVMAGMGGYDRKFIETLGPIALNYFFATSAYFFFSSEHCFVFKMKKRIKTLCLPFVVWNTLYILLYILQNGIPNLSTVMLGYTLEPFDGPLWYIFVLYIFFGLSYHIDCIRNSNSKGLLFWVLLISICASLFHQFYISGSVSFVYDYWFERTIRMIPAFLFGAYCGKNAKTKKILKLPYIAIMIVAIVSWGLAIYLEDCFVTVLLLYICTVCVWFGFPNINFKLAPILCHSTFLIYVLHEGIVIVLLAFMNNIGLSNAIINRTYFIGCLLIFLFIVLGTAILINKIIEQCPVKVSEMLTGGRSGATHNKRSFVKNIKNR